MINVTVVTNVDSLRPNLAYKVEFEDEDKLQEWLSYKPLAENYRQRWVADGEAKPPNTVILVEKPNQTLQVRQYDLEAMVVMNAVMYADQIERDTGRVGSGRYPKRVLLLTTSKERREGRRQLTW